MCGREIVLSQIWMSRAPHMNETWHTYEWVMSHLRMSHVTHINQSCHTQQWVLSHIWMSRVTHMHMDVRETSAGSARECHTHLYKRGDLYIYQRQMWPRPIKDLETCKKRTCKQKTPSNTWKTNACESSSGICINRMMRVVRRVRGTATHCKVQLCWEEHHVWAFAEAQMRYDSTRCNTLQHTATHCNTLQHTATHCNTHHIASVFCILTGVCCTHIGVS